jgi:hypothetical protein
MSWIIACWEALNFGRLVGKRLLAEFCEVNELIGAKSGEMSTVMLLGFAWHSAIAPEIIAIWGTTRTNSAIHPG